MSKVFARNAAHDAGIGAILGLLLVSGLVTSSLDMRHFLADGQEPVSSLAAIVSVVVTQCAIAAAFCGVFVRKFFETGDDREIVHNLRRERLNRSQLRVVQNGRRVLAFAEAPSRKYLSKSSY